MANITVSASNPVISVASTLSNVAVSDVDSGQLVTSISTSQSNVTVSSTSTEVTVGGLAAVANTVIRSAVSASDNGGDGSFTYDQPTGVFTYTGPSASEVRAHFSNTSPITYSSSTGVIGVDPDALFSGKTTDDLPQGSTNKYFSTSGAAVNTDNLAEGSTNLYFTNTNFDNRFATKTTDDLTEGSSNLYFTTARVDTEIDNYTGDFKNVNDIVANGLALEGSTGTNTGVVINYQNPSSNPSDQGLVFDRPGATANAYIVWSETGGDKWLFSDGSNVYTMPRTTTDLTEGANLYYSNARVLAYIVDNGLDFNAEKVDDQVANLLVAGNSIDLTYDDSANTLTIDYQEDVVSNGNQFGDVSFDINAGTIHQATLIGDITGITLANISAGDSATLLFTQDLTGSHILDTTTTPSNWTNWDFADNNTELSQDPSAEDVISVIYDGTTYYASIVSMEDVSIPNSSLSNSNVIINGTTFTLGTSGTLNTFNTDVTINGNLEVQGNIDYVNSEDLLVKDQSITLNYGNATARDAFIYVDRSGSVLNNAHIKWNETSDQWEIYDGTSTYKIPTSTTDLAEGTNLYYTQSRFDTAFSNKTTTDLTEGTNLYYTDARVEAYLSGNTSTINADTIEANAFIGGTFTGEGSDLTDVRAESVEVTLKNNTGTQIDKGYPVHAIDYSGSGEVVCILADAGNAETMPAHFIAQDNLTAGGGTGRGILAGRIQNVNTGAFTEGDTIFVAVGGGYANVAPSGEANLIQNLGVVTRIDASNGGGEIMGAGRTAATPNLDDGKFFLGNASNKSTTAVFTDESNTAFDARNLDSSSRKLIDNVWAKDFGITDNLGAGSPNYYFPNGSPGSAGQFLLTTGADQLGFSDFTDESNSAIDAYTGTMLNVGNITSSGVITADDFTTHNINQAGTGTTGINVNLTNKSSAINVNMPFLSNSNVNVTDITSDGYSALVYNQFNPAAVAPGAPADGAQQNTAGGGPSANAQNLFAFVANATVTAGNTTVVIDSIGRLSDFRSNSYVAGSSFFSDAANITTVLNEVRTNSVVKADRMRQMTQVPFAKGSYITSIDASNATITLSQPPIESATLTASDGGTDVFGQNCLWMADGAFNTETNYAEMYISYKDALGAAGTEYFPLYTITCSLDRYGAPLEGYTTGDLTYTTNNPASWTAATYTTSGRTVIDTPDGYLSSPYGLTVGDNTTMGYRAFNDNTGSTFGLNVGWDGLGTSADYGGVLTATPQISLTQYTDNTTQSGALFVGPRMFFSSRNGNVNVGELSQYPRATQELGRLTFWGTTAFDSAPATNSPPGYISVAAADDWTDGSNTNMYFVATSNYSDTTSRDPFLSYESGELILTSGQPSNSQANIQFAPTVQIGANPQDAYDFSSDAQSAGSHGWATINYSNVSATSGAEISINNGMSTGAGTVGDMKLSLHRKDNSYSANTEVTIFALFTAADADTAADVIQVAGGVQLGAGNAYTFSGITDSNWTFLNGNTYSFVDIGFGGNYRGIYTTGGSPVVSGGASAGPLSGGGIYEFVDTIASGVTDKTWALTLAEQSENLTLTANTTTQITFTDTETQFATTAIPVLPSYANTSLPGAGTAGGMIMVTGGDNAPAYSSGSDWKYIYNNTTVT